MMDVVGGIVTIDMVHKGWTCQSLQDSLALFHNNILDSILQEKCKDLLGDIVGSVRGGRTKNDTNPYDDGTKASLLLSQLSVGKEVGRVDGQPANLLSLD